MTELKYAYLAGAFDANGLLNVTVAKAGTTKTGYDLSPQIRITSIYPSLLDLYQDLADEHDIRGRRRTVDSRRAERFEVTGPDEIEAFLDQLGPYLTTKRELAVLMVEEFLPRYREKKHCTKEGFYEMMAYVEIFDQHSSGRGSKYDLDYFYDKWGDDLNLTPADGMREKILQ